VACFLFEFFGDDCEELGFEHELEQRVVVLLHVDHHKIILSMRKIVLA
jgi:hypothetical protein